ncbi:hypothetical protein V8G54_030992 [Vigna mungo]|uniref:Uncharacterized protein n=1 Tax=Vigna mungo TaxID=3915 RepID=A0AAQ3MXC9_VIGMU
MKMIIIYVVLRFLGIVFKLFGKRGGGRDTWSKVVVCMTMKCHVRLDAERRRLMEAGYTTAARKVTLGFKPLFFLHDRVSPLLLRGAADALWWRDEGLNVLVVARSENVEIVTVVI